MAITKVAQFSPSPGSTTDYQAQNAHLSAFIRQTYSNSLHLTEWSTTTVPQIAQGVYLHHAGVLYIVDAADFDIAAGDLSAAGTYYIKLTTSGDSLAVAWEDTLTSYAWSVAYQGLYNGTSQILPYLVNYDGASAYNKYKIENFAGYEQGLARVYATVDIGDWDMDTNISTSISHNFKNYKKVRSFNVIIRNDDDNKYDPMIIEYIDHHIVPETGVGSTYINLARLTGGVYDNTDFDSTTYNRGWVHLIFEV